MAVATAAARAAERANFIGPLPQSPSQVAASWQGSGAYSGVDTYINTTLSKGTQVVGSVPGQSPYYTTLMEFKRTGGTAEGFYEGLQIQPNLTNLAYPPYRSGVTIYEVGSDTRAAVGSALANPQFGPGGIGQVFIPNFQNSLTPIYSIPFKR